MSGETGRVTTFLQTRIGNPLFRPMGRVRGTPPPPPPSPSPAAAAASVARGKVVRVARSRSKREERGDVLRVSVNLRYSRSTTPLLPFDVYVVTDTQGTLDDVYAAAVSRDPDGVMKSYKLRKDRSVYVLGAHPKSSAHANVNDQCGHVARSNPMRLIFCVSDHPLANARKGVSMLVNARQGDTQLLGDDLHVDVASDTDLATLWRRLVESTSEFREKKAKALSARRGVDNVVVRIALQEIVSDVVALGAPRYVFEVCDAPSAMRTKLREEVRPMVDVEDEQDSEYSLSDSELASDAVYIGSAVDDMLDDEDVDDENSGGAGAGANDGEYEYEYEYDDNDDDYDRSYVNTMPTARASQRSRIHGLTRRK